MKGKRASHWRRTCRNQPLKKKGYPIHQKRKEEGKKRFPLTQKENIGEKRNEIKRVSETRLGVGKTQSFI